MNYIDPTGKNEVQLMPLFTDENLAFQHALHWGLLADGTPCELCGRDYEIVPDRTVKYGYRVKCHFCNAKKSIFIIRCLHVLNYQFARSFTYHSYGFRGKHPI